MEPPERRELAKSRLFYGSGSNKRQKKAFRST
jgi:hypothetical protein